LIVAAPRGDDPAPLVAAAAVAVCEAIEQLGVVDVEIKWPNDVWIGGRKVAGILLERAEGRATALIGIGLNLAAVPAGLEPDVAARTTCLFAALGATPSRTDVLARLLVALDRHLADAAEGGDRQALEDAWRGRLALLGCSVRFRVGTALEVGTLEDASFDGGLLVRDAAGPRWRAAAHVQDLTAAGR
jgi:BirA family biotin operon repressor/biotin-[acetyl-CoA-carboxylase] ligase